MRSRYSKFFIATLMALMISNIPHVAAAEVAEKMIPTIEVVESLTRAQAEAKVQSYLDRQDVQVELKKLGLSAAEMSQRMASLSVAELNQLATQMDQARYGGEVVSILLIVLLVVLIIYLAKRI
jgi:hypothetical protein